MQQEAIKSAIHWGELIGGVTGNVAVNAAMWAVMFGLCGLVLAVVIMVILARKRWLRRRPPVWNVVAKLSYVGVLAGAVFASGAMGAVYGAQRYVTHTLRDDIRPALEAQMPALRISLGKTLGNYLPDQSLTVRALIEPYVKSLYYAPTSDSYWERTKARMINGALLEYAANVITERFKHVVSTQLESLGSGPGGAVSATGAGAGSYSASQLTRVIANGAHNVDFTTLDATIPEIVVAAIYKYLSTCFNWLYLAIVLTLILLSLVIGGEIFVYSRYHQSWRAKSMAGARIRFRQSTIFR